MHTSPVHKTMVALLVVAALAVAAQARQSTPSAACPGGRVLLLTNGRIHTMDAKRSVASSVRVANGRVVDVGEGAPRPGSGQAGAGDGCTDSVDLGGRTVIPGMIDNHFHVQLVGNRPGYETRTIETAFSIAEVQQVVRTRARDVPDGAFITAIGGLLPRQFA